MKIIHKDKFGFWIFSRYTFIVEDQDESLTEMEVTKEIWKKYKVGDFCDSCYKQFYTAEQAYPKI